MASSASRFLCDTSRGLPSVCPHKHSRPEFSSAQVVGSRFPMHQTGSTMSGDDICRHFRINSLAPTSNDADGHDADNAADVVRRQTGWSHGVSRASRLAASARDAWRRPSGLKCTVPSTRYLPNICFPCASSLTRRQSRRQDLRIVTSLLLPPSGADGNGSRADSSPTTWIRGNYKHSGKL